jgi:16S rRNA processing protein RimM
LKTLEIGFVERAHGLRGELRVRLHFIGSDALDDAERLTLCKGQRRQEFEIVAQRRAAAAYLVQLTGVASREEAEKWRGATVEVERAALPPLEPGEYYLADLVGATVRDAEGEIGVVTDIAMHPTVDSVLITTPAGLVLEQPLVDAWLLSVDTAAQVIVLKSRDGLIGA